MDDPGYAGSVAEILQSATPIPEEDDQGPGLSQKSVANQKSSATCFATRPQPRPLNQKRAAVYGEVAALRCALEFEQERRRELRN
jgi:hypothetical protein